MSAQGVEMFTTPWITLYTMRVNIMQIVLSLCLVWLMSSARTTILEHMTAAHVGDSCRNGNMRDAGTLKNYNCNVHHFWDIEKIYSDKILWFWDETMSQLKSSKMKV